MSVFLSNTYFEDVIIMKKNVAELNSGWNLTYNGKMISAKVPGDINIDLFEAGIISDPYYGINHQDLGWILKTDFEYSNVFDVSSELYENEEVLLQIDSIDTFAEIYINGKLIGKAENMFLQYSYDIKPFLKKKDNFLKIKMISTASVMDTFDEKGFFGTFNTKRLFIRKAQCHFGWDWAPDMPGYGICGEVRLVGVSQNRMETVNYKSHNNGMVSIFANLNYSTLVHFDKNGQKVENSELTKNDKLRFTLAKIPNVEISEDNRLEKIIPVAGIKNFVNFKIDSPELWWPAGYGEQPLYRYNVELIRDGEVVDRRDGKLAFRQVELIQEPIDDIRIGYKININGTDIFAKGSNWVPAECFIGCIKNEKYRRLITEARDANFNMLRVWGGGIYEKDIFYDICDELGIMVWQDLMFACGDVPECDPNFVENCKREIEYQIQRLRNHPSIVYWCGGNEKTGSYGLKVTRGEYFFNILLRGIVNNLDDTRPYATQSPCSLTDVGNDSTSGECHAGSYESSLKTNVLNYRDNVSKTLVPFISECAIMGPSTLENIKRIFPEGKLWPINEYWDDRLMDNPYSVVKMKFPQRQLHYAEEFYGKCERAEQFIAKGMTVHAEAMRAESEYARANKGRCWGFMNWMYTDIWPSSTWAVIDYNCEPKQVYYQMKRSYAPLLLTFVQRQNKVTELTVVNDMQKDLSFEVRFGQKTLSGEILTAESVDVHVASNDVFSLPVKLECMPNTYFYAESVIEGKEYSCIYSPDMWHTCSFTSDYSYEVRYDNGIAEISIAANSFAKGVTLRLPENHKYTYSDNYVDIEAGKSATVRIYGAKESDMKKLIVTDFAKEIK